mmetsp:Transcript_62246/g.103441  ORF Transcript_62246/g.103441 Transcript_62246/m.103441 type:complete len:446 (+) Transcript_62246:61-1398(+)
MHRMQCSSRDALAGIRSLLPKPDQHRHALWTQSRTYAGRDVPGRHAMRCAQQAFDAFLCSLPAVENVDGVLPPNWAFGKVPATLGKFFAQWAMHLYLGLAEQPPRRFVLGSAAMREWSWRPEVNCAGAGRPGQWLHRDVCKGGYRTNPVLAHVIHHSHVGQQLLAQLRGNVSNWRRGTNPHWIATIDGGITDAGLWCAGQLFGRVRESLEPCGLDVVRSLADPVVPQWASMHHLAKQLTKRALRRPTVALQVRRGDACERWAVEGDGSDDPTRGIGRPCYQLSEYLRATRFLLKRLAARGRFADASNGKTGGSTLLLATDSSNAEEEFRQLLSRVGENFELRAVQGSRGEGWGGVADGINLDRSRESASREFIEQRNGRGLVNRTAVLTSLLADLRLVAHADGFVGTSSSWASRLCLLAIIGQMGTIPPFVMLDRPLRQLWFASY